MHRTVARLVTSVAVPEGAGVTVRRSIGLPQADHLDPFLLLDEIRSDDPDDYIAGFPDHPHRGFETVTYLLHGSVRHEDHRGNRGDLVSGSVQWMTAGRGIVHSEMPQQEDGLLWGFQIWVNLPASHKMCEPRYQDIPPAEIPEVTLNEGIVVRVLAGSVDGTTGPVRDIMTQPVALDVRLEPGRHVTLPITPGHTGLIYLYRGDGKVGGVPPGDSSQGLEATDVPRGTLAILSDGDALHLRAEDGPVGALLLAAQPLNEPVARWGPFVMNTRDEIIQAVEDYQRGRF